MNRWFIGLGAVNGFLAVALGAFAAHGLRPHLSARMLEVFQTGVDYHMTHALALILIGIFAREGQRKAVKWSGGLMLAGIVLFSGSLYVLALSGIGGFGVITPVGGTAFLGGWLTLAWAAFKPEK